MQDPDTGEKLTGHEWVKHDPEEFAERYKDHLATLSTLHRRKLIRRLHIRRLYSYMHSNRMHNEGRKRSVTLGGLTYAKLCM
jgi:hypothetical protein